MDHIYSRYIEHEDHKVERAKKNGMVVSGIAKLESYSRIHFN